MTCLNKGIVLEEESPYGEIWDEFEKIKNELTAEAWRKIEEGMAFEEVEKWYMAEKDVLWKNFIADPEYKAVTDTIAPTGLLHDYYQLDVRGPLLEEDIEKLKDMIVENGAVRASHWGADSAQQGFFNYGEWYSTNEAVNHGQVLVGWDDDYLFKLKDEDGNELKGAFIMKNSWGSTVGKAGCRRCLYLCRLWLGAE